MATYHIAKKSDRSPTGSFFVSDFVERQDGEPIGLLTTYFPTEALCFKSKGDAAPVYWEIKQQFPKYQILMIGANHD